LCVVSSTVASPLITPPFFFLRCRDGGTKHVFSFFLVFVAFAPYLLFSLPNLRILFFPCLSFFLVLLIRPCHPPLKTRRPPFAVSAFYFQQNGLLGGLWRPFFLILIILLCFLPSLTFGKLRLPGRSVQQSFPILSIDLQHQKPL